jgi:hypothetical protein
MCQSQNAAGEEYGIQGLKKAFSESNKNSAAAILSTVMKDHALFTENSQTQFNKCAIALVKK